METSDSSNIFTKEKAELSVLKSKAERNEAEKEKLKLEAKEIENRIYEKWYETKPFLRTTLGVFAAAVVIVGWFLGFGWDVWTQYTEAVSIKLELQKAENKKTKEEANDAKKEAERSQAEAEASLKDLKRINEFLERDKIARESENVRLQKTFQSLKKRYSQLETDYKRSQEFFMAMAKDLSVNESQRVRAFKLVQNTKDQLKSINAEVVTLQEAVVNIYKRAQELRLSRSEWRVNCPECSGGQEWYMRLDEGHFVGHKDRKGNQYKYSNGNMWELNLQKQKLFITWRTDTGGVVSYERYTIKDPTAKKLEGTYEYNNGTLTWPITATRLIK